MTVAEIIVELQKLDQDLSVGSECWDGSGVSETPPGVFVYYLKEDRDGPGDWSTVPSQEYWRPVVVIG